jgi:uncharacterized membrane protein (DUF2068 family)
MMFDDWPLSKRAATLNILGVAGVAIGFASSDVKLAPNLSVPIAVFTLAVLNFLFFVVRPQLVAAKAVGRTGVLSRMLVHVVQQRPLILLLVINQLIGVSQLLAVAATLGQLLITGGVHALPNASSTNRGMIPLSVSVMTGVAMIWLLSAIGLWRSRSWAWWLALCLNALVVVTTVGVGLLALVLQKQDSSLFGWREAVAIVACIVLLLPVVRNDVRHGTNAR